MIRNEFTHKTSSGRGTRGSTPGQYVLRYMARDMASEPITPATRYNIDTYITKYMVREGAVEQMDTIPSIKNAMYNGQRRGGSAFGYGDVALSDEKLRAISKDIQRNFDKGKVVMKTVLSFNEDYLRSHNVVDEDFEHMHRGDFRGHIDQMKLRMAIMSGLEKLSHRYDDLKYVGVIQVDTNNVHCHLTMVDRGRGRVTKHGTQQGTLRDTEKSLIRRGIDQYLDRKQHVKMLSSSVTNDRRNVLCYVKKFTHKTMARQGLPQFLIACLPKDRTLWRAGTNNREMRKANNIVREFVVDILNQNGSGYAEAVEDIRRYAGYRAEREGLSDFEKERLVQNGQNRIIEASMNAVYGILLRIPENSLSVRTPMLSMMSMDYEEMASQVSSDPMMEFGFKLRTYSSRINHHRKEFHKFQDEHRVYEDTENKHPDSKALGDFLLFEANYNAMLMVKYQYFLSFLPSDEDLEEELEELTEEKERLENLRNMRKDPSFRRMFPDAAEDYGLSVYGQRGGRRIATQPEIMDQRIRNFENRIERMESDFKSKLLDHGMSYDGDRIVQEKMYSFNDVKALDLHHLGYDFPDDVSVSDVNVKRFRDMAELRYKLFEDARDYLVNSGQDAAVSQLPVQDVTFMKQFSDKIINTKVLSSTRPESMRKHMRDVSTVRLGHDYLVDINSVIRSSVYDTQAVLEEEASASRL